MESKDEKGKKMPPKEMKNAPSTSADDNLFEEPTEEFTSSTVRLSMSNILVEAGSSTPSGGKKRSFRRLSTEESPLIPLNDDCVELIMEHDGSESEQDEPANETPAKPDDEQEMSILKSMTMQQMQEHVAQCLQLSTENKINTKNAFALKLIDCMTIMSKNDEESNFTAMACQLDAGAKIYSHRVDAVHQQVMKLAETCILAEKHNRRQQADEEGRSEESDDPGEGTSDGRVRAKRKKNKKKVLATKEQITRKPKEKDPREEFVRLDAQPGEILTKAKRDSKDLSLTLDRHTPFWQDFSVIKAKGTCEINFISLKTRLLGPPLQGDREIDMSGVPQLLSPDDDDSDYCDDPAILGNDDKDLSEKMDAELQIGKGEDVEEMEVVSQAKERMTMDGSAAPSRLDVIKAIFHQPGENEYHYFKMDNSAYWAGPSYWKRPHHVPGPREGNKKKVVRKKKEPKTIEYTVEPEMAPVRGKKGKSSVQGKVSVPGPSGRKAPTTLSKRACTSWAMKNVTFPPDIHFDAMDFQRAFNIIVVADILRNNQVVKQNQRDSADEDENPADDLDLAAIEADVDDNSQEDEPAVTPQVGGSESANSEPVEVPKVEDEKPQVEPEPVPSTSAAGPARISSEPDAYVGDNLVPMVKMVKVEPIKYTAKPNRVDMQHLKEVMLSIIVRAIEDRENEMRQEGVAGPRGHIMFKDVLTELFGTDQLHYRTREDLTVQMAFLCLLTLTNEHSFSLVNESGDVNISYDPDEPRPSTSSSSS